MYSTNAQKIINDQEFWNSKYGKLYPVGKDQATHLGMSVKDITAAVKELIDDEQASDEGPGLVKRI